MHKIIQSNDRRKFWDYRNFSEGLAPIILHENGLLAFKHPFFPFFIVQVTPFTDQFACFLFLTDWAKTVNKISSNCLWQIDVFIPSEFLQHLRIGCAHPKKCLLLIQITNSICDAFEKYLFPINISFSCDLLRKSNELAVSFIAMSVSLFVAGVGGW